MAKIRSRLSYLVLAALLGAWYVLFAPTAIGGPAAYVVVSGHSMDGTYATGDLIVTRQRDSYGVGDIVTFEASGGRVIHRITGGDGENGYVLQGDNNADRDPWRPTDDEVVGESWIRFAGKAWVLDLPRSPLFAGSVVGLVVLVLGFLQWDREDDEETDGVDRLEHASA